jgi:hypothetical protein
MHYSTPKGRLPHIVCILACSFLVSTWGCESSETRSALKEETSRLKPLVLMYGQALGQNGGRPPANEEQFKSFIAKQGEYMLQSYKLDSIDELFISERDGEPYVVFYGKPSPGATPGLCAYEKVGVNGNRYVGYTLGIIEEVDEAHFRELVPKAP